MKLRFYKACQQHLQRLPKLHSATGNTVASSLAVGLPKQRPLHFKVFKSHSIGEFMVDLGNDILTQPFLRNSALLNPEQNSTKVG